jgi:hypothetical protein
MNINVFLMQNFTKMRKIIIKKTFIKILNYLKTIVKFQEKTSFGMFSGHIWIVLLKKK